MLQNAYLRLVALMLIIVIIGLMAMMLFGYVKILIDIGAAIFTMIGGGGHG